MKTVSRFNFLTSAFTVLSATLPFSAFALGNQQDIVTPIANGILALSNTLVLIVFVLAIVAFGWGIVQFIFAGGDPAGIAKAKSFLLWGVIGMAVMASLFGIINFMQRYLGIGSGTLPINVPTVQ